MSVPAAIVAIEAFQGDSLTAGLAALERQVVGLDAARLAAVCSTRRIDDAFMASALSIKNIAGQINVIIHAAGILLSLPAVLEPTEVVESVSLGAGNTGRKFDLETNRRVAEYKFIDWRGGSESIRQNSIFKDFFDLAEHETTKRKYLYVVGTYFPMKFFLSGRALSSVLSRQPGILSTIQIKYGSGVRKVRDYYLLKQGEVTIEDIGPHVGRTG